MFSCTHCEFKTSRQWYLNRHIKLVHEGIAHQCPHCNFKTAWKVSLTKHVKLLHKGEKIPLIPDVPIIESQSSTEEDDIISDDEEQNPVNDKSSTEGLGQRYLCPLSSCTFSYHDGEKQQERAHFVSSHSDVQNIDNLHFIRL